MKQHIYRLKRNTIAVVTEDGQSRSEYVPAGDVITVEDYSDGTMINVLWNGRVVQMFGQDIQGRGAEIRIAGSEGQGTPQVSRSHR